MLGPAGGRAMKSRTNQPRHGSAEAQTEAAGLKCHQFSDGGLLLLSRVHKPPKCLAVGPDVT